MVLGKPVGGGVPCAVYGFSAEWAERAVQAKLSAPPGHSGIGITLSGNLLTMAAMRATLSELMTTPIYAPMVAQATRLAEALRNGSEAGAALDAGLEQLIHLA